ncbi:unnamed protein product [Tetraodon nigroviridis]|uniref:Chromosome 1 SCAF14640, whole genome shotgun sequence n=1 Tax=Tetraodon nigroviridis TaxID=99883 RepID=Q4SDC3_TETNG|nr:unnamed protein product [Tetraodon nigroviridis]
MARFRGSSHPDTGMKDEMEIVTDAIILLLIEGVAKLSLIGLCLD